MSYPSGKCKVSSLKVIMDLEIEVFGESNATISDVMRTGFRCSVVSTGQNVILL